ncbi:hypothetical protein ACFFX1_35385 [Dactylosporangium sucinum]|uniref:NfeD-like C-terminal domain-containing protein n=1 Tax=Dactylosporangium sucinum TaxID=1424081 RepID=A0A917X5R8_9ACTN|nr:hypothetical protein [Dactylosporangium sucinum]GGM82901.1 hypothetical protein GCM10007977_100410 [Dactylosporangium sucinum]
MSAVTLTFLAIGGLSLLMTLLSLRFRHLPGARFPLLPRARFPLLPRARFPHLPRVLRGRRSGFAWPAVTGFTGVFGFGGAVAVEAAGWSGGKGALLATAVGLAAGIPAAWLTGRFVAAVAGMPTDATPRSADLVGATGVVISEVPAGGLGQVRLTYAGQPMKFHARAAGPLPLGVTVVVIGVNSPTSVDVAPLDEILMEVDERP